MILGRLRSGYPYIALSSRLELFAAMKVDLQRRRAIENLPRPGDFLGCKVRNQQKVARSSPDNPQTAAQHSAVSWRWYHQLLI